MKGGDEPPVRQIGIDLGGTKIAAVVLEGDRAIWEHRIPSPASSYEAILAAIAQLVAAAEPAAGPGATIGIGIPGAIDPATELVKGANTTVLIGRPFGHDLEATLGRPVRLANDANCLIASEAADGAARGHRLAFGVILGTGVGGGLAIDGRIHHGANAIAGEWGHNPLPWPSGSETPGPPCYCGRRGCIETFLSGPGFAADHAARFGAQPALDAAAIIRQAAAGDPQCQSSFERYCDRLARALAAVINLLDPDVIVLGGGLSRIDALYQEIPRRWGAFVFSPGPLSTRLKPAQHGDASGVRGAARLWL